MVSSEEGPDGVGADGPSRKNGERDFQCLTLLKNFDERIEEKRQNWRQICE